MEWRGHPVGWRLKAQHAIAEQLVFSKIRAGLGGHLRLLISGGAALDPALALWFEAIGIKVREGWGLSETTAPATANGIDHFRFGTVGTALSGTEVSLADDGEILVRGPGVFQGYLKDEAATAAAFTDEGLFRTGDLGQIEDGFVRIVGRSILVTAGGIRLVPLGTPSRVVRSKPPSRSGTIAPTWRLRPGPVKTRMSFKHTLTRRWRASRASSRSRWH